MLGRQIPYLTAIASFSAVLSVSQPHGGGRLPRSLHEARGENPQFSTDPDVTEGCTFWYDHVGDASCASLVLGFSIPVEDFISWVSKNILSFSERNVKRVTNPG